MVSGWRIYGKPTPVASYRAGSICAFSGLNDDPDSTEPGEGGKIQSWATARKYFLSEVLEISTADAAKAGLFRENGPGAACRGFASNKD